MKHTIELHKRRIPRRLLALDALGALLAAAGVLDLLDTGIQLVPPPLRFHGAGIVLLALGCLLMLTVPVWLLQNYRRERDTKGPHT